MITYTVKSNSIKRFSVKIKYLFFFMTILQTSIFSHENKVSSSVSIKEIEQQIQKSTYVSQVLPYDFSHMTSLLIYGKDLKEEKYVYMGLVMKLYTTLIKQTSF